MLPIIPTNTGGKASPAGAAPAPSRFAGSPGAHGTGTEGTRGARGGAETPKARGLPQLFPPPRRPRRLRSFGSSEEATPRLHPEPGSAARDAPALPHPPDVSACRGQRARGMGARARPSRRTPQWHQAPLTPGQSPMGLLEPQASSWDAPHGNAGHPSRYCMEESPAMPLQQLLPSPLNTPNLHSSPPLNPARLRACPCTLGEAACAHPHVCTHTVTHGKTRGKTPGNTQAHNGTRQTTRVARGKCCTKTPQPPLTTGISKTGTG